MLLQVIEGHAVAVGAVPDEARGDEVGDDRRAPPLLPLVDIREVHLDDWDVEELERVVDRPGVMRPRAGVDDYPVDGVVLNPGAWTHYSYAVRDAVELFEAPVIEVHLSNVDEREEWRRVSLISELAAARFVGMGPVGYYEALAYLSRRG